MKGYIFNGEQYADLNSLALAYKNNFELGVNDIYKNSKKLIKFVKSQTKNKERRNNVINDLSLSRYKENALTFIIFEFLDVKEVVINGVALKYDEFVKELRLNPNKENNILFAFLEDHGITRCYKRLEPEKKIFKDSYFIEKNCYSDFTYTFLTKIDKYEVVEQPEKKLSQIAIQNEECFRRSQKTIRQEDFMLFIAKKFGFKEAITIYKEKCPVFYTTKLFKDMVDDEELRRLISDGFYWWLLNKYKMYDAKGEAKQLIKRIERIEKEYKSYLDKIKTKEISKIAFDFYSETSRKLYLAYIDFVYYFRNGLITPKKDTPSSFNFDKPYCKTYITEDYMKGRVIKLYTPDEGSNKPKINPLTGEEIPVDPNEVKPFNVDDVSDDKPSDEISLLDDNKVYEHKIKEIKSNVRFAASVCFLSFFILGLIVFALALKVAGSDGKHLSAFILACRYEFTIGGVVAGALSLFLSHILVLCLDKKYQAYDDYNYHMLATCQNEITLEEEEKLYRIEKDFEKIKKTISKDSKLLSLFVLVTYTVSCAIIGVLLLGTISAYKTDLINPQDVFESYIYLGLVYGVSFVLSFIFGLALKKKGFITTLFFAIIAVALAVSFGFIF